MMAHHKGTEEELMSKKQGGSGGRVVGVLATTGAVYLARKLVTVAWTRTTGRVPPTDPADPAVSLGEALGWAVVAGVTIEAARLLATRATARRPEAEAITEAG
jgi:hypothetical protein